jgi:uncharacterized membrane protein YczE
MSIGVVLFGAGVFFMVKAKKAAAKEDGDEKLVNESKEDA